LAVPHVDFGGQDQEIGAVSASNTYSVTRIPVSFFNAFCLNVSLIRFFYYLSVTRYTSPCALLLLLLFLIVFLLSSAQTIMKSFAVFAILGAITPAFANIVPRDTKGKLPAVSVKGNAFFAGNNRFYVRGVAYQPGLFPLHATTRMIELTDFQVVLRTQRIPFSISRT
jgi:hypothetical protein